MSLIQTMVFEAIKGNTVANLYVYVHVYVYVSLSLSSYTLQEWLVKIQSCYPLLSCFFF